VGRPIDRRRHAQALEPSLWFARDDVPHCRLGRRLLNEPVEIASGGVCATASSRKRELRQDREAEPGAFRATERLIDVGLLGTHEAHNGPHPVEHLAHRRQRCNGTVR
jgi:hypothetical protein